MTVVREVLAKSALSQSRIPGASYCVNPYVGCAHACRYCYASFMKRFTGHGEPWGDFVDVRVNAPELLEGELRKARKRGAVGRVMLSSVTDAYQPIEEKYGLARRCLAALIGCGFPVDVLTKSPLVLRDLDLLEAAEGVSVGLTITTDNERVRAAFEPGAPSIRARLEALASLSDRGVSTYAFVAPLLPMNPERLAAALQGATATVYLDRMNYEGKTSSLFRKLGLTKWLDSSYVDGVEERLLRGLPRGRAARI